MTTQHAPYYEGQTQPQTRTGSNGMAIASLVLGIVSLLIAAFITGVLAIVFGGIGVSRANERGGKGKTMSIWGIALGVVGVAAWIALLAANHGHIYFHVNS